MTSLTHTQAAMLEHVQRDDLGAMFETTLRARLAAITDSNIARLDAICTTHDERLGVTIEQLGDVA